MNKTNNCAVLQLKDPLLSFDINIILELLRKHRFDLVGMDTCNVQEISSEPVRCSKTIRITLLKFYGELDLPECTFGSEIKDIAQHNGIDARIITSAPRKKIAIFVSQQAHCLLELLEKNADGELFCDIEVVISNHLACKEISHRFGVPFHYVPVSGETKSEVENLQLELLNRYQIDLVVLAKYMQVLSKSFVSLWTGKIINIHHSFLPAFEGARPYERAHSRGVKAIGATAHYVTEDLDQGPIIEQLCQRVSHKDLPDVLAKKGKRTEREALLNAVRWHLEGLVVIYGNQTAVFNY